MRLSPNNFIAVCGFLVMSTIGVFMTFGDKLVRPLSALFDIGVTEATVDNEYMQRDTTRKGIEITAYAIKYGYVVDGKPYRGESATGEVPKEKMAVQYMKSNPGISGMELKGNALFDIGIFSFMFMVFAVCLIALLVHFKSPDVPVPQKAPQRGRRT